MSAHLSQLPPPRNPAEALADEAAARQPVTQTVLSVSAAVGVASAAGQTVLPSTATAADHGRKLRTRVGAGNERSRRAVAGDGSAQVSAAAMCTAQVTTVMRPSSLSRIPSTFAARASGPRHSSLKQAELAAP